MDTGFSPAQALRVHDITVRQDGVVEVVGDAPATPGNATDAKVLLLNPDGSLLLELMPDSPEGDDYSSGTVTTLLTDTHGKLIVGGLFQETCLNRTQGLDEQGNLVRCSPPLDTHHRLGISRSGRVITWTRLGGLARLENVTFAVEQADGSWQELGSGIRLTNGCDWAMSGVTLPPGVWHVRARGQVAGGTASWHEITSWLTVRPTITAFDLWLENRHNLKAGDEVISSTWGQSTTGIPHLLAYAAGVPADEDKAPSSKLLPEAFGDSSGTVGLRFARSLARSDVIITAQRAEQLTGPWTDLARNTGGTSFLALPSADVTVTEENEGEQPMVLIVEPAGSRERQFYRLQIELIHP